MINIVFVLIGAALQAFAFLLCINLKNKVDEKFIPKACNIIMLFIIMFFIGYILFFIKLFSSFPQNTFNDFIISTIFLAGAIFVLITLKANHKMIIVLADLNIKVSDINTKLEEKNADLEKKSNELMVSEIKYKEKSKELEKTLDDFYTLRLGMENDMKKGTVHEENEKIKKQIENLKNKIN